jgi:hypothetical protein
MRLSTLHPELRRGPPNWGSTEDFGEATSIEFDCPGCVRTPHHHRIWAPFLGRYQTNGAAWTPTGTSIDTLSFVDVPGHSRSIRVMFGCCSHFNVTNGAIDFYSDSGHTKPRDPPMTEQAPAPEPLAPLAKFVTAVEAPIGYVKTLFLHFLDGVLHQRHDDGHGVAPSVWVPVSSTTSDPKAADVPDESAAT